MPISDWMPSVSDVGALLRARTKDSNGTEVGTFNDLTRPTGDQVVALIQQGGRKVASVVGADLPTATWSDARAIAVLATALLVELSYFPEQIGTSNSPYLQIKALYDDDIKSLKTAVVAAGGDTPGEPGSSMEPVFAFPLTGDPFIIGRRTAW